MIFFFQVFVIFRHFFAKQDLLSSVAFSTRLVVYQTAFLNNVF